MTTRILHVTLGSASFALQQFARGNPHGVIRQTDKTVTTFGVVHYFRTVRSLEDCENLRGMDFNCIMYEELNHTNLEAYQWLMSRCREPAVIQRVETLKLTTP